MIKSGPTAYLTVFYLNIANFYAQNYKDMLIKLNKMHNGIIIE